MELFFYMKKKKKKKKRKRKRKRKEDANELFQSQQTHCFL